jgi:hypothetical protein
VLHWGAPLLALQPLSEKITAARELLGDSTIQFKQESDGVLLKIPPAAKGQLDRVVVLTIEQ